jgi:hypothetical protein
MSNRVHPSQNSTRVHPPQEISNDFEPSDSTLSALAAYNTNGFLVQTSLDTFTGRTLSGSTSVTITDGNGVAGNPVFAISATYTGQTSITTLGTITTGVWAATPISHDNLADIQGGTAGQHYHLTAAQIAGLGGASLELEMEMAFKQANLTNYKVLTWTLGQLTAIDIWETPAMLVQLFGKTFSYTGDQLDQTVLTRMSDSATLTRSLAYDIDGNLVSVTTT